MDRTVRVLGLAAHGVAGAREQIEKHRNDPARFSRTLRRPIDGIEADLTTGRG